MPPLLMKGNPYLCARQGSGARAAGYSHLFSAQWEALRSDHMNSQAGHLPSKGGITGPPAKGGSALAWLVGFPPDCTHCDLLGKLDALLIAVTGPPAPEGREAGGYDIECVEVIETPGQSKPMTWALHFSFSLLVGLSPSITIHYQPVNVGASRTSEIPATWPGGPT